MADPKKSSILNQIKKRAKGGWAKSRKKEAEAKGQQLPDGVTRGVAQFSSYKIGKTKKGDPYISLNFVAREGIGENNTPVKGTRFNVLHVISPTSTKSIQDKLDGLSNDLQLCGAEFENDDFGEVEEILDTMVEEKPLIYFNTWKGSATPQYPNPEVRAFIQGVAEGYEVEDEDENEDEEEEEEASFEAGDWVTVDNGDDEPYVAEVSSVEDDVVTVLYEGEEYQEEVASCTLWEEDEEAEDEEEEDEAEEEEDEEEEEELEEEESEEEEEDEEAYEDDAEYEEVEEDEEEEDEEEEDDWAPEKEDVFQYKPPRAKNPVTGIVTTVSKVKRTVSLKTDKKVYKDVSWDDLED